MQQRTKVLVTFLFLVLIVMSLYLFTNWFSKVTGYFLGEPENEKIARCLTENGAQFYGSEFCAQCEKQKKEFGRAFSFINSINCGKEKENCANIREIPAWYIDKKIYYGFKNITELRSLSSC